MGNKSQMLWDIPPMDSFRVLGEIYACRRPAEFRRTLDELVNLLDMQELLTKPVRNLSLGERMKCELVAGLLYRPAVFFLDEPTLGLDVSMQFRLRRFIAEYNQPQLGDRHPDQPLYGGRDGALPAGDPDPPRAGCCSTAI